MRTVIAVLMVVACVATASAQKEKKGAAELLFKEGKRLMDENKLDEACPKFEESQRLDPAIGTLLNLARCYEIAGKTGSAWQAYVDAASMAKEKKDKRAKDAQKRANALEPKVPRLVLDVKNPPADLVIVRDGEPFDPDLIGVPVPGDPGTTTISATAPGHDAFEIEVDLLEGETTRIPVKLVATRTVDPDPDGDPDPVDARDPIDEPEPDPDPEPEPAPGGGNPGRGRKILGVTVGVIGLGGLGASIALAMMAATDYDSAFDTSHCQRDTLACDPEGLTITADARSQANLATWIGGAGLVAVVVGTVLFLTAPDAYVAPVIDEDSVGLAFGGRL